MLFEDLMDMKLKDVLDEFCMLYSPECDYYYGIARWDDVLEILNKCDEQDFDVVDFLTPESIIPLEYFGLDDDTVIYGKDKLYRILEMNMVNLKE